MLAIQCNVLTSEESHENSASERAYSGRFPFPKGEKIKGEVGDIQRAPIYEA